MTRSVPGLGKMDVVRMSNLNSPCTLYLAVCGGMGHFFFFFLDKNPLHRRSVGIHVLFTSMKIAYSGILFLYAVKVINVVNSQIALNCIH